MWDFIISHLAHLSALPVLLAASAFFSGSETAFFNLERHVVRGYAVSTNAGQRLAARLLENRHNLLVTILFGNMVVNVLFFSIASMTAIDLARTGHENIAALVGVGALAAVLLFGEITPKAVAQRLGPGVARRAAFPLFYLVRVVQPASSFLEKLSMRIISPDKRQPSSGHLTTEELQDVVDLSAREGHLDRREKWMLERILTSCRLKVRDVMVARVDMVAFDLDRPMEDFWALVNECHHSRIPVYRGRSSNLIGIVYIREALLKRPGTTQDLAALAVPAVYVPETKTLEGLLVDFQRGLGTTLVVVNEFGGIEGLVTAEDVVEEIVGPIVDEFDQFESPPIQKLAPGRFRVDPEMNLAAFQEAFDVKVEKSRAATVSGFIMYLLGHVPREGESLRWGPMVFNVTRMTRQRIREIEAVFPDGFREDIDVLPEDGFAGPSRQEGS